MRHASKSDNQHESVADHCWRLALMAVLITPHLQLKLNQLKLLKMAIIHDLVEIESRDVPLLDYLDDKEAGRKKETAEKKAMQKIKKMLGSDGKEVYDLWLEFEELKTNEAKVLKSLDRFEGEFQFLTETVTTFTKKEQKVIDILIAQTTELAKIDPFLEKIDEISLSERKNRIKS
jgi:putative hydrolase of HD superfamily